MEARATLTNGSWPRPRPCQVETCFHEREATRRMCDQSGTASVKGGPTRLLVLGIMVG